jgi:hypothetical protein
MTVIIPFYVPPFRAHLCFHLLSFIFASHFVFVVLLLHLKTWKAGRPQGQGIPGIHEIISRCVNELGAFEGNSIVGV